MSNQISNAKGNSLIALNLPIFIRQNPYQRCVRPFLQQSTKIQIIIWKSSLKLWKNSRKALPTTMLFHLLVCPWRLTTHGKKKTEQFFQSYESDLGAKWEKSEKKNETLNRVLKKWLLVLRSENILISGALLQEKTFELGNEVNIEGFQGSKGWLEN